MVNDDMSHQETRQESSESLDDSEDLEEIERISEGAKTTISGTQHECRCLH